MRILKESNLGDEVVWDIKDIARVEAPGDSGGSGPKIKPHPDDPEPHFIDPPPETIEIETDDPDEADETKDGKGKSKGSKDGTKDDTNIDPGEMPELTSIDELSDEQKEELRKKLEEMAEKQDKHIEKDSSPDAPDTKEHMDKLKRRAQEISKKAREHSVSKNPGRDTSGMWGRVESQLTINEHQVNWKQKLREFFRPWISLKKIPTYSKPARRDLTLTGGPPTIIRPGARTNVSPNKLHIFVTVDTSGSVDDDMLATFISEIRGIFTTSVSQESNIEVRVIFWTGNITGDILLNQSNFEQYFANVKRTAWGSTNFDRIKAYLTSKNYKPVAIVHFTDADMDISEDMMFRENGCKNAIVIPNGYESSLKKAEQFFDMVIPVVIFDTEEI